MKDNKLIAKFMGAIVVSKNYNIKFERPCIENHFEPANYIGYSGLLYNTSWDWLMTVVEKIESLDLRKNGYDFPKVKIGNGVEIFCYSTYRGTCYEFKQWYSINGTFHNHKHQCNTKIEATYKAVVEFIKWYNKK